MATTRSRRRALGAASAAVALALVAAACTSADGGGAPATTSSTTSSSTTTTAVDPGPGPMSLDGVGIRLETAVTGLADPTSVAVRPMRDQLWVTERSGKVRIVSIDTEWDRANGRAKRTGYTLLPGAALDLSGLTTTDGERGLLGLAFSSDGRTLYLDHTATNGDVVVASYAVEDLRPASTSAGVTPPPASSVVKIDPASRVELLRIPHGEQSNHNGGQLVLGPDGYLYVGVGDGGGAGDPDGSAQDLESLTGKILRIDPTAGSLAGPYGIPPTNPYAQGGGRPEIYLSGVRNPWRFSFDRANGDLWVADVGQNQYEEIDWLPGYFGAGLGANLGWNWFEGDQRFTTDGTPPDGLVAPLHTYTHDGGACAVTGGYVYRGTAVADLDGVYLYGDYCTGQIRGLLARSGIVLDDRALGAGVPANTLVSFGQDDQEELYVLSSGGTLSKVVG
jgi:glucose/arabinose dehydrogenase